MVYKKEITLNLCGLIRSIGESIQSKIWVLNITKGSFRSHSLPHHGIRFLFD